MTPLPIEDYALIGDRRSAALVGRNGSIDWLCLPRFDSAACFAALLGDASNGRWQICPRDPGFRSTRAYLPDTLVLETRFETGSGVATLTDFMIPHSDAPTLVRLVRGISGHLAMSLGLCLRFDYGLSVPWVTRLAEGGGVIAVAGPDQVVLRSPVKLRGEDMTTVAAFTVQAGDTLAFVLSHGPSHLPPPAPTDALAALEAVTGYWRGFAGRSTYGGRWAEPVTRSLITLKALAYEPTGGIVAAPTTSLPEQLGGGRNWDYRFCWLRDATLTLHALMGAGYTHEAARWRDWLQRSIAGSPAQVQIMYGIAGERRLAEWEVPWLAGYQGAAPVRIGNGAADQMQLDVYGEVLDCLHQARRHGLRPAPHGWALQRGVLDQMLAVWDRPDQGMWEGRGPARHFTFSKIMAWVALDRMITDAARHRLSGPVAEWRGLAASIRETILRDGYDSERNCFVQSFGSRELDASLLLIPQTGFLPATDPRVRGTIAAIERELLQDGFVLRYRTESAVDGLPPGEGAFLACTFWLAEAYAAQGRQHEAEALFERLLDLRNDVGLLSEEYDPKAGRLVGNFPQAFSHVGLVATALALDRGRQGAVATQRNAINS